MHELERHNLILLSVQKRPVLTVPELCELTGASEATIRRDIISLDQKQKLRRFRGGVSVAAVPEGAAGDEERRARAIRAGRVRGRARR